MTEQQLRKKVADVMLSWVGAVRGDARHKEILRIYNNHRPLACGYTVQQGDAYCATTASAAYISAGISEYTGTECSCPRWIDAAKKLGVWVENDAYQPKVGDAVFYDWQDSGTGDNQGGPDHVGIVTSVSGNTFVVTEGNINGGKVGQRTMQVNGRYIRGFICPPFAKIADEAEPDTPISDAVETPSSSTCTVTLPVLKKGITNGHVRSMQSLLRFYFDKNITVDGNFGKQTDSVVRAYQKARGLGVDGVVGALTWAALLR